MKTPAAFLLSLILPFAAVAEPAAKPKKSSGHPEGFHELKIGDTAPDFDLIGIDEERHTLQEYADADLLVIAFLSNHCPTSQAVEGRVKKLVKEFKGRGLRLVAINPNDPAALRPDELGYSKYNDSFPEMKSHAKEQDFNFPYLYDGETQKTALAYGCLATPHVMIFDKERKLRYQGRLDDSRYADESTVKEADARNAIAALLEGRPVPVEVTKPHGCSTKWIDKRGQVAADDEKWEKGEVEVELIDAKGVAALRRNDTKKVRLFNVWATWCGPCTREFPDFMDMYHMYRDRDFEFISISADNAAKSAQVLKFLQKQGASCKNYQFTLDDKYKLIEAIDTSWQGALPYTLLVEPGGKVVYKMEGAIDPYLLKKTIVNNHLIGKYP